MSAVRVFDIDICPEGKMGAGMKLGRVLLEAVGKALDLGAECGSDPFSRMDSEELLSPYGPSMGHQNIINGDER
jgi:hypothetical protein